MLTLKAWANSSVRPKSRGEDIEPLKAKGEALKNASTDADAALLDVQSKLDTLVQGIPNIPDAEVPIGQDESDNVEVRRWGTIATFDFEVKDHVDLGHDLKGLDFDKGR
jgi:seryl-tRNA synthetase